MPNYANGKIYKIVGDDGSTYYGSTTRSLEERKREHGRCKNTTACQHIVAKMDWEMILIENYPCESRKELERREGTYIRENPCVNSIVVGRTPKKYYQDNREEILGQQKVYYEHNREAIQARHKVYRAANRESQCARHKVYHAANRELQCARHKKRYYANREESLAYGKRRSGWIRSFGSIKYENNLQRCDYTLFQ